MKKNLKLLALVLCLTLFATMALGSGSSDSKDVKDIVDSVSESVSSNITINEQVLFEQEEVKVTAVFYDYNTIYGDTVKLLVENNSDKNIRLSCDQLIVIKLCVMYTSYLSKYLKNASSRLGSIIIAPSYGRLSLTILSSYPPSHSLILDTL